MKHYNITFEPDNKQILIHEGATVAEAAGRAGIILNTVCGGKGVCRKCTVVLEPGKEEVLACQYRIVSDLTVVVPRSSVFLEQIILTEGTADTAEIEPDTFKSYLEIAPNGPILGVAVDIGTTTVVAKLFSMADGRHLATEAVLNPQTIHGDDVISRIGYAQTSAELAHLQKLIIDCLNRLIERLCTKASANPRQIYEVCAVGNTTMNHILLKLPIKQLGQAPYKAFSLDAHSGPARHLGLRINPAGRFYAAENIAGFVGSDTVAVGLATCIYAAKRPTLAIDIGTNGEIILGTADRLCAASCAAGPAFEGARITYGSRAVEGAIQGVFAANDDIDIDVIGGGPAYSICGSGLIDAVAVLLDLGVIDTTGRFTAVEELREHVSSAILARMTQYNGQPALCLAEPSEAGGQRILLTQKDVREAQLAKAAIRSGIKLLEKEMGIEERDIENVFMAGAFGNYIRRESALRIGLLPNVAVERIRFVGNAAASGAQMMLLSTRCRQMAHELACKVQYIEIAHEKDFNDIFAESILF
jgi:uncharacterized 2Fe-2S/4Fe-4S cluster protein (DUF4445 family)